MRLNIEDFYMQLVSSIISIAVDIIDKSLQCRDQNW